MATPPVHPSTIFAWKPKDNGFGGSSHVLRYHQRPCVHHHYHVIQRQTHQCLASLSTIEHARDYAEAFDIYGPLTIVEVDANEDCQFCQ